MPATDMLAGPRMPSERLVYAAAISPEPLASIVYRSRAIGMQPDSGLQSLVARAQARNRSEDITGIVVYDRNRFFQWLEGPADGIGRVLSSIRRDPRHTDLEILAKGPTSRRRFSGWDMKLAVSHGRCPSLGDVLTPCPALLEELHRDGVGVAASLDALAPRQPSARPSVAEQLETLVDAHVLPELLLRHTGEARSCAAARREARALVPLLVAADGGPATLRIESFCRAQDRAIAEGVRLGEAVAAHLAALWADERVSDLDIAVASCRLQSALRHLLALSWLPARPVEIAPRILVAVQPGEPHHLGAALVAAMLEAEGWSVERHAPADDAALRALAASAPFDAVCLSLSPVFRRDHRLPHLAASIASLRGALARRETAVIATGRIFAEPRDAAGRSGADAVCGQAGRAAATILQALRACRIRHRSDQAVAALASRRRAVSTHSV